MITHPSPEIPIEWLPAVDRDIACGLWRELEARLPEAGLSCSWTWTSTWLDAYGARVPHWFAIGTDNGRVVGAALVTCASLPGIGRAGLGIINIGTAGEPRGHSVDVEYNRLLVEERFRPAFTGALLQAIRRHLRPVGIRFPSFLPRDVAGLRQADPPFTFAPITCPIFDLAQARGLPDPVGALRSSVRSRVRRSIKALGPVRTEWATSVDEATDILDELIELHQIRWRRAGRPGAFASERFTRFHRDLIAKLLPTGGVVLFRVRQDHQTIGCLYSFVDRGMVMFYQSGLMESTDNRIKPGLTTHMLCIEACLVRGYHTYNFLGGNHRYKDELATGAQELVTAHAWNHRLIPPLIDLAARSGAIDRARSLKRWRESAALRWSS